MSLSFGRHRRSGFDGLRRAGAIQNAVGRIASSDPRSPPDSLATQLAKMGRVCDLLSARNSQLLRSWLLRYLQPLLKTMDEEVVILKVERQLPTEGTGV